MKFYIIKIVAVEPKAQGAYRIMANTQETAEQRAQSSFRNEFGVEGTVEHAEQVD